MFNEDEKNYLISPSSIKLTLAMLLEGSKRNTAQEISLATGIPVHVNSIRETLHNLTNELSSKSENTTLNVGNIFAVSNKYTIREEYIKILQELYNVQATSLDFSNSAQSITDINGLVKSKTKGFINAVINNEHVNDETSLIIINVLFFKALWKFEFTQKITRFFFTDTPIRKYSAGMVALEVKSMFRYRFVEELNAQAVELPYSDGEFAMLILLPKEKTKVDELQINLLNTNFSSIIERLETSYVLVSLPKFDIEFSTNLKPILAAWGIEELFLKNANLSGIVEQGQIMVNKILHKARLDVNEKGNLHATPPKASIINSMGPSSESVIANRPFLFFIYNMNTKNILFEGRLNSPLPRDI